MLLSSLQRQLALKSLLDHVMTKTEYEKYEQEEKFILQEFIDGKVSINEKYLFSKFFGKTFFFLSLHNYLSL